MQPLHRLLRGLPSLRLIFISTDSQLLCALRQVLYVEDLTAQNRVERELVLIKVRAPHGAARTEVTELAKIFRARIVDASGAKSVIKMFLSASRVRAKAGASIAEGCLTLLPFLLLCIEGNTA